MIVVFFIIMEDFGIPYLAVFKDVTAVRGSPVVRAYQASKYLIVVKSFLNFTQVGSRSRRVLWIRIGFNADPDPAIYRNADPDPRSLTNANPDSSQILLLSKKVKFLHEKNSKQVKGQKTCL